MDIVKADHNVNEGLLNTPGNLKRTKQLFSFFIFSVILVFSIPGPTYCKQLPLWEAGFGGAFLYMPDYRGSDESRAYALPFPYVTYRGEIFKIDRESITGLLFKTNRMKLVFSPYGSVPVDSSKNKARQGMPNLDPTFEIGPSLEIIMFEDKERGYNVTFNLPVRAVFPTDFLHLIHQGWTFSPRLNIDWFERGPRRGWNFGMAIGSVFGDQTFHDYYYRVDKVYATADRPAYSPQGGYSGLQLSASLGKYFNKLWMGLFARADFLNDSVFSDSPLVKTKTSILAGFAISYFFWESKTLVESEK